MMTIKDIRPYYKTQPLIVRLYIMLRMSIIDVNRILRHLPENIQSVMELACGYGIASFMMANKYKNKPIRSYDIDKKRIDILNTINPHESLSFYHTSVLDVEKFDAHAIVMIDLLHHIRWEDQERLLRRIHQTAPDDALVIVKDMDKGRFSFRQLCNYLIDVFHTKELHFFYRTKNSFRALFESCGFKVKKVESVNRPLIPLNHILFVLKKG